MDGCDFIREYDGLMARLKIMPATHSLNLARRRVNDGVTITCRASRDDLERVLSAVERLREKTMLLMAEIQVFGHEEGYVFEEMSDAADAMDAALGDGFHPAIRRLENALSEPCVKERDD